MSQVVRRENEQETGQRPHGKHNKTAEANLLWSMLWRVAQQAVPLFRCSSPLDVSQPSPEVIDEHHHTSAQLCWQTLDLDGGRGPMELRSERLQLSTCCDFRTFPNTVRERGRHAQCIYAVSMTCHRQSLQKKTQTPTRYVAVLYMDPTCRSLA